MNSRFVFAKFGLILSAATLLIFFVTAISYAQSETEPRTIHTACSGDCVADQIFIHSGMSDHMAKNGYHAWFDSYYTLTGCGEEAWKTDLSFLFDIISDAVGAPGGNTMQCWQGLAAQGSRCSDTCSDYFICDLKYAPNVKLTLASGSPGFADVTLDNQSNLDNLPELEPNAYSRRFFLLTTLQLNNGEALLVDNAEIPSLSFPNWITRGGYDDCATAYGAEEARCKILEWLNVPSQYSTSVQFQNGVLYDITNQVKSLSSADGSFNQNGYVRLLRNGDSLTVKQGPYSGLAWVKTHNLSSDTHSQRVIAWDASQGDVTIVNRECNSWLSSCWVTGDRTEVDTYVFALQGPAEKLISGTYTVKVNADIAHEKDAVDNAVSYSYNSSDVAGQLEDTGEVNPATPTPAFHVADLPVTNLNGADVYPIALDEAVPGAMFHLVVPEDIRFMFIRLVSVDGNTYGLFVRRGQIPVPDFPIINDDFDCLNYSDAAYDNGCPFTAPAMGDYYIFVDAANGGSFRLEVEWTTASVQATQIAQRTQTAQLDAQHVTPAPLNEVENNNTFSNANSWNMQKAFVGQISKWNDYDVVHIDIGEPGIYTFSVTNTGQKLRAKLELLRAGSGYYLDAANAVGAGQDVSLTFDASAGESYYLKVRPIAMSTTIGNQPYTLSLTGFIPDPYESNDKLSSATVWDPLEEPVQGYFWDKTTGLADCFTFTAPQTLDNSPVTFSVTNPSSNLRIRMQLMVPNGLVIEHSGYFAAGQPASLTKELDANKVYTLKLDVLSRETSILPYTLSASFTADGIQPDATIDSKPVTLNILAFRPGLVIPLPVSRAEVYAQITGQAETLLGTTGIFGTFSTHIDLNPGQELTLRLERPGLDFEPQTWNYSRTGSTHRAIFIAQEAILIQTTPTPTPQTSVTPQPPLIQTALATSRVTAISTTDEAQITPSPAIPTALVTPQPSVSPMIEATPPGTMSPPSQTQQITIRGFVWRLFSGAEPAGVGAAKVIVAVNGVEQPAALSMIDGSYTITVPVVNIGDKLTLRAENPEDNFEPIIYRLQAESNVTQYTYDFYSCWGEITPSDKQSRIYGRVTDVSGKGMAGVRILLQTGTSDAYMLLGPTDNNGYYEAFVSLPSGIMITVRTETAGYAPSRIQFFHSYVAVNRELNFTQTSGRSK